MHSTKFSKILKGISGSMDFGAETCRNGWWAEENALPPLNNSDEACDTMSSGLAREYVILAGVAMNMRSGFILLNASEEVTYSNPSAKRLLGIGNPATLAQPLFDVRKQLVSLAADPESARAELDRIWLHPEQESSTDLALADAAVRWLRVQSFPVRDDPGHLLGRGVLLDDITLERISSQARNETLALAAHELKTPLAIIKGSATTLLGSSMRWDPALQREMLQMIDMQADRLHDILNRLLDVWRLDAGAQNLRFVQVNIFELLQQLVERWQTQAPRHRFVLKLAGREHEEQSSTPTAEMVIICDAPRIEQAFNALLDNAVTYSPAGATIKISLESNDVELCLSVSDQGAGIAAEYLERIFDRFYRIRQGEERSQGSGLGLALARATIEAHGGRIWADSAGLGQGATFYCTLPFTPQRAQTASQQLSSPLTTTPGRLVTSSRTHAPKRGHNSKEAAHILLAEHDARMLRYLRAHLEEQHYRVQTVNSGVQFLRQLDLDEPDVILLATHLADMDGIELLQRLREFSHTPVIMLCDERDMDDEDERVRLLDLGAHDVVQKPLSMKELLARIRVLLRCQATAGEPTPNETIFVTGDLVIDYAQHQVQMQGRPVQLSRTEYKLLRTLAQNAGRVMTHELLLERVWGAEYNREVDFIWVYISRLRRKIEPTPRDPRYILTVPDVGYKLAKL
jgi:DNA-binding response OmpR family regulator/signal transduction histidine kinase